MKIYGYAYTCNLQELKKPSANCVDFSKSKFPPKMFKFPSGENSLQVGNHCSSCSGGSKLF